MINLLQTICQSEGIRLDAISGLGSINGMALKDPESGIRAIAYNDTLDGWSRITTIAHEIGHHALGHLDNGLDMDGFLSGSDKDYREKAELEARVFASVFTALAMFTGYYQKETA